MRERTRYRFFYGLAAIVFLAIGGLVTLDYRQTNHMQKWATIFGVIFAIYLTFWFLFWFFTRPKEL